MCIWRYVSTTDIISHHTGFEQAALPTSSEQRKQRLLHFAIVGGGRKSFSPLLKSAESAGKNESLLY